ncbi:MAG TPA: zinc metallopeptidase [Candidatus Fimousia stercorigallinarum]|nr:zinc metallopeptidase [Candidatus Fimousia stercorigallinarum]
MYFYDPTYILVLIGVVLCLLASAKVNNTFNRYSHVRSASGMTGREAAERILHICGIRDVRVEHIGGNLTDHYDPSSKVLRLSDATYNSTSVAAIGVAAHECGHAVQHHTGYAPLVIRSKLVPAASFGSKICWPMIIFGIIAGYFQPLITLGIILFSLSVLFQLVTLPVEFNASGRALKILEQNYLLGQDETRQARQVLSAAALTYVASAASAILQLLRLVILFGGRRDD